VTNSTLHNISKHSILKIKRFGKNELDKDSLSLFVCMSITCLFILNVISEYKCMLFMSIDAVVRPGDPFVNEAISSATSQVQNAINITRSELFDRGKTHNVEDLLSLFRYPSAETLEIARAEEIFEQTLEIIHRHVADGHSYNLEGNG
jgi:hypothetical protein